LNRLEHTKREEKFDFKTELAYIKKGRGQPIPVSITCDVFIVDKKANTKYAFELDKMPSDNFQIRASKEKMFKLLAMNPPQVDFAFYALPYNSKETFLTKWFDIEEDESVLIGDDFWNLIGGEGAYSDVIDEINLFGERSNERICN
jgi:Type II restriction endonuclease, TdeIII